ncbi:metallophosphoesterase [Polaribacter aestuariivivens]|uniref:Metallophosphoesterase n=1 Tax=Polaribacter aestuariivivens TaxID=2304626 RepID=A0A5S3NCQ5_9FLAO|nr:metallophosphatase domain-containing protein [Polaribacter aestuariivivens]TMM31499.1 metallophosphoesterase [Polaribacter aestuariivivens]
MKIVLISDTHGVHNFRIPDGDVLIHAGDVSSRGRKAEIDLFVKWFQKQPHKHKIFIAGNHDFYFEEAAQNNIAVNYPNLIYLNDSGCEIDGIKFWGSPIQPTFFNWAFNRNRGKEIKKHWDLIPNNIDVLITHGPPYKVLDLTKNETYAGCEELKKKVLEIKPKLHVFGHIHEAYGKTIRNETIFVNASLLDHKYKSANTPILVEV